MALRSPPSLESLDPAGCSLDDNANPLQWQSYRCQLVTPLYGGGVQAGKVDPAMPIRASAIRGQLRFWWRLLARHKWKLGNTDAIRRAEFALWGGVGSEALASMVHLRVLDVKGCELAPWAEYQKNPQGRWKALPTPQAWANAPYALFPAQGKNPDAVEPGPSELAKAGLGWTLALGFAQDTSEEQKNQVNEALRWWAAFGGIGARSRRGLGAVQVDGLSVPSPEECQSAQCQLTLGNSFPTGDKAWMHAINKLRDFRQKDDDIARRPKNTQGRPGQSHWPEADAARRLTGRNSPGHEPKHPAGKLYPRAAFGLPILLHFKDEKAGDPHDVSLEPVGADRLASPLILRPVRQGDKWHAAALLLPTDHLKTMRLKLPDGTTIEPGAWWDPAKAELVPPLKGRGDDALSAFLHYFAKS